MMTVGRRHTGRKRGESVRVCSYCGVPWHRSKLVRDANGYLACPDDRKGRVEKTLEDLAARDAMAPQRVYMTDGVDEAEAAETPTAPWWENPLGTPGDPTGANGVGVPPTPTIFVPTAPIPFDGVVTALGGGGGANSDTEIVFADTTFTGNSLALLHLTHRKGEIESVTATGGITFELVASIDDGAGTSAAWVSSIYRALAAVDATETFTVAFNEAITLPDFFIYSMFSVSSVNTSGTAGAGAVAQSQTRYQASGANTSVTLAAFSSEFNATWGALVKIPSAGNVTAGSGFTELADGTGPIGATARLETQWKPSNDTGVDWTHASAKSLAIALEIRSGL